MLLGFNDLLTTNPELIEEWDCKKNENLKPTNVMAGSTKKVWWKCEKGHSWEATINSRSNGRGCPICSNKRVLKGFNDLATTNPDLSGEWDCDRNGDLKPTDVTAGCGKKVWWLCKKGHSWEAVIYNRSKGIGCPYCAGLKALAGFNDLSTTHPQLAKEWNYEKNGDLKPTDVTSGSGKKVWWKCEKGHSWQATICDRSNGCGCPKCKRINRQKTVICIETGEVFESVKEATKKYKTTGIQSCCIGKTKTSGGYHWKYAVDVDPVTQE